MEFLASLVVHKPLNILVVAVLFGMVGDLGSLGSIRQCLFQCHRRLVIGDDMR